MTSWGARQDSIVFRIDRETPLSLERLTFGMMALGAEYERFVRKEHPKAADHEADLLVQRVTEGSIVIELIGAMQPLFQGMNNAVVFGQFVDLIGAKIGKLIYASDLAGQKIKGAWSDEKLNPYELGFVVDVDVQTVNPYVFVTGENHRF